MELDLLQVSDDRDMNVLGLILCLHLFKKMI